jgi:hypothetical protein
MAKIELDGRIGHKRDTDAALAQSGFVPLDGELVLAELDGEVRLKAGDGVRTYAELPFLDAVLREEVEGKADVDHTHAEATESAGGFMPAADKEKLDGIEENANNYTHPTYTSRSSGLYKITVNSMGHVSSATNVTKADIVALGIPSEDTNTTYGLATASASGLMSASDKSRIDSLDVAWVYSPHPTSRTATTIPRNSNTALGNRTIYTAGIHYVWLEFWADLPGDTYMAVYIKCQRGSQDYELAANTYQSGGVQAGIVSGFFPLQANDYLYFNVFHSGDGNVTFRWRYGILRLKKT